MTNPKHIVQLDEVEIMIPRTPLERLQRVWGFKRGWKRHTMMVGPPCGVWIRPRTATKR